MPLDEVGQRYAENLFTTGLDELSRQYLGRISEARQDFSSRGLNASNTGLYHSRMLELALEHVEAVGNLKADSLLSAYSKAGLAIDDAAVQNIMGQASQWIDGQIQNVARRAKQEIERNRMAGTMSNHIDTVVGHRAPGISSRLRMKLNRVRDEQLLESRNRNNAQGASTSEEKSYPVSEWSWAAWWKECKTPAVIIGVVGVLVAVLTIVATLFPNEIRHRLGFDKPALQAAPTTSPNSTQQQPRTEGTGDQSSIPSAVPGPSSSPHAKPIAHKSVISSKASEPTKVVNAPNGIAITGGTVTNPTVNNYGPPPVPPAVVHVCASQSTPDSSGATYQVFTLITDSKIDAPRYELSFDRILPKGTNASSPDMAMNIREGQSASRFGFEIFQTWYPEQRINVEVRTTVPIQLLNETGDHGESFVVSTGSCSSGQ